jgi:hypothetical protein
VPSKRRIQRVLIVGSDSLLGEGLQQLLEGGSGRVEVSSVAYSDNSEFVRQVLHLQPTVIVLFEGGPLSVGRVFELINDLPNLPIPRVIMVLAESSTVDVYEKRQITVAGSDVLLDLIDKNKRSQNDAAKTEGEA